MTEDQSIHPDAERWGGWSWREPARGEHFRTCSFCGSIHPVDLANEPNWFPNWSDMKYGWPHKFYVDIRNREPDRLFVHGAVYGPQQSYPGMISWADLTDDQRAIAERDGHGDDTPPAAVTFGTRANHYGKFYSIHLMDPAVASVKDKIERRSGVRFTFFAGKLAWERWDPNFFD